MKFRSGRPVRSIRICLIAVAVCVLGIASAEGQSVRGTAELETLAQDLQRRWDQRRSPLYYSLLQSNNPTQQLLNNSPGIQLMGVDARGHHIYYITHNLNAAKTTRTNEVWPGGSGRYDLTGSNTRPGELGIWDQGLANIDHVELVNRVHERDVFIDLDHATHVAGTMVATGIDPLAKGMSYQAHLLTFTWTDDTMEMAQEAASGLRISNHSYGSVAGWNGFQWHGDLTLGTHDDWKFGFYDSLAAEWDQIAYAAPLYLIVKSSGNDRNDTDPGIDIHQHIENGQWADANDYHPPDGDPFGFDTISSYACAKNILTVGAVKDIPGGYTQPSDVVQTDFSSWGPADDGRIKPDIVANGDSVYSARTYPDDNTSHGFKSGTSMATPNVSGSVNLLRELYESTFLAEPRSATLKAIVLHTADEAGGANGPDYSNGWGLLNTRAAADLITASAVSGSGLTEGLLTDGNTDYYYFSVPATGDVRVTVVWTDPPGTPPVYVIDPVAKMLVNDLDLRLLGLESGTTYEPWRLDKSNPLGVASPRDNEIDNVERIDAYSAPAGLYRVAVSHKGTIANGDQLYSLIWTGMLPTSSVSVESGDTPRFTLEIPSPNPVSGVAVIRFSTGASGPVAIEVFDPRGRRVKTLLRDNRPAGPGTVRLDTRAFSSGVYFVKMVSASREIVRKIEVVR